MVASKLEMEGMAMSIWTRLLKAMRRFMYGHMEIFTATDKPQEQDFRKPSLTRTQMRTSTVCARCGKAFNTRMPESAGGIAIRFGEEAVRWAEDESLRPVRCASCGHQLCWGCTAVLQAEQGCLPSEYHCPQCDLLLRRERSMAVSPLGPAFYEAKPIPEPEDEITSDIGALIEQLNKPYGLDGNYRREVLLAMKVLEKRWRESVDGLLALAQEGSDDAVDLVCQVLGQIARQGGEVPQFLASKLEQLPPLALRELLNDIQLRAGPVHIHFIKACLDSDTLSATCIGEIVALGARWSDTRTVLPAVLAEIVADTERPEQVRVSAAEALADLADLDFGGTETCLQEAMRWWDEKGRNKTWA